MGKFSTGLIAGAMLGIGAMVVDKRTIKRAKRIIRNFPRPNIWL